MQSRMLLHLERYETMEGCSITVSVSVLALMLGVKCRCSLDQTISWNEDTGSICCTVVSYFGTITVGAERPWLKAKSFLQTGPFLRPIRSGYLKGSLTLEITVQRWWALHEFCRLSSPTSSVIHFSYEQISIRLDFEVCSCRIAFAPSKNTPNFKTYRLEGT